MSSEGHEAEFDSRSLDAIADADPYPYWYEDADQPLSNPTLVRTETCDLCIVGGGYTGLWAAIIAKERDPSRDVVLIDAHEIGSAASGRNGGFMDASLTHGIANGQERFPKEIALLENWEEKLDRMAESVLDQNICIIAGVPSWTLLLLQKVLEKSQKQSSNLCTY